MATRTCKPKSPQRKVQVKDLKATNGGKVKGGAYEFYVHLEGTKQGKFTGGTTPK